MTKAQDHTQADLISALTRENADKDHEIAKLTKSEALYRSFLKNIMP